MPDLIKVKFHPYLANRKDDEVRFPAIFQDANLDVFEMFAVPGNFISFHSFDHRLCFFATLTLSFFTNRVLIGLRCVSVTVIGQRR